MKQKESRHFIGYHAGDWIVIEKANWRVVFRTLSRDEAVEHARGLNELPPRHGIARIEEIKDRAEWHRSHLVEDGRKNTWHYQTLEAQAIEFAKLHGYDPMGWEAEFLDDVIWDGRDHAEALQAILDLKLELGE